MTQTACTGWWFQQGYGRQPMEDLVLQFDGGLITGSGTDIIGAFTFAGEMESGEVNLLKQYIGQHSVDYIGTFDGEGTMQGDWFIGSFTGEWLIKIVGALQGEEAAIARIGRTLGENG